MYILAETITNPKSKPYFIQIICNECPEATTSRLYDNRPSFELHFKKSHQNPVRYSCSFCEYKIEKFQLFRAHFNKHMNSDRHRCTVCNETFSQKSDLKSHTTSMHNLRGCRKCDMKFDSLESLRQHKTVHAAEKSEKTECPDCGKILLTTGGYFTHRKMHQEKPKFICDCGKEFFQKVNFVNHQKTHSGTRNFRCEIDKCEAAFFEKSHLQRHLNFHSVSRDHQCQVCNKFYKTERCLKVHSLVHQSFRPFVCDICNKGFLSSSKLKQHSNIHTGLRPFKCKHCIRDFTNYPNLLKHTIRRHKVDHRTGEILLKIPDYVTNNKKKAQKNAVNQKVTEEELNYLPLISPQQEQVIQNVIEAIPHGDIILDDDLPSTSGLIRSFNLTDDSNDFDILDIDKEFDDFKILMSDNEQDEKYDEEPQFSISCK